MTPLFAAVLTCVSLLLVGALALSIYLTLYGTPPPLGPRWAELAAQVGLELEPHNPERRRSIFAPPPSRDRAIAGIRGGWRVRVVVVDQPTDRRPIQATRIEVGLPHSLELGLHLYGAHGPSVEKKYTERSRYVVTGEPSIDKNFVSFGHDRERIADLVRTPYLLDGLSAVVQANIGVMLEDHRVQTALEGHVSDPATIHVCIDTAIDLAQRLLQARAELPEDTTAELGRTAALEALAARLGLQFDPARGAASGRVDGAHVEAFVVPQMGRRHTHFIGRFERPVGMELRLRRQNLPWKLDAILGAQDIETGDPVFDGRFLVQGGPEDVVRAALGPELRLQLSELQDVSDEVSIGDEGVRARRYLSIDDPAKLETGLRAVAAVVNAIHRS